MIYTERGTNMVKAVLTIDDIASENTPAIIDYLKEKNIPVLMFAWGEKVEQFYDNAVYALQNGVIVGNHSYTHPFFSKISYEDGVKEIEKTEALLDKLYKDAGVERKYRPFRFPYGDKGGENKDILQKYLAENGFDKLDDRKLAYPWWKEKGLDKDIDTFWSFDFAEYNIRKDSGFTKEDVFKRMEMTSTKDSTALFEDGAYHFLLLHAHDETEELVPGYYRMFLDRLIERGVVFEKPEFMQVPYCV